jgi:hypothetical protein
VGSLEGILDETAALDQLEFHVLPGVYLLADLRPPRAELVRPGLDGVLVAGVLREREAARPAVVFVHAHRRLAPARRALLPVLQHGGELVVPLFEEVGPDLEAVADLPLHRVASAVQLGIDVLDNYRSKRSLHPVS